MKKEKVDALMKKMRENKKRMNDKRLSPKQRGIARVRYQHAVNVLTD